MNATVNEPVNVTENVTENRNKIILKLIRQNNNITTTELSKILNVARRTIARDIDNLKNNGKVKRVGSDKGGYWEIIELNN
ncbi:MAG: HTH domain-containing protein [Bacteroidales bacterium]|nr:HTH domain-containing protein [Bacteroidales bacterium]